MTVFAANTNLITLTGLQAAVDASYINDATVVCTIKTAAGVAVTGATAIAMAYVAGSDGNYRGVLPATVALADGSNYVAHIDADGGTDRVGHWEFKFVARTRRTT